GMSYVLRFPQTPSCIGRSLKKPSRLSPFHSPRSQTLLTSSPHRLLIRLTILRLTLQHPSPLGLHLRNLMNLLIISSLLRSNIRDPSSIHHQPLSILSISFLFHLSVLPWELT